MANSWTTLTPLKPAGTIDEIFELDCVYDAEKRQAHLDSAVKRKLSLCINRKERPGKVAIVASGPSASDYIDLLKEWDGEIWGINGAFAWLMHRGVKPTGFVGLDPEPILKDYLIETPQDATYYIAASCHPDVFDHLKDRNVRLWFPADSQVKQPSEARPVYGGSTCLTRAPNLARLLGWCEVHIFGGDSSFTHKSHVYGAQDKAGWITFEWHGRVFQTSRQMVNQACEFTEQMVEWARPGPNGEAPVSVTLYGDGLMQAMYATTLESGNYQQYLREAYPEGLSRKQRRALRRAA